jgi:hypothetical protein
MISGFGATKRRWKAQFLECPGNFHLHRNYALGRGTCTVANFFLSSPKCLIFGNFLEAAKVISAGRKLLNARTSSGGQKYVVLGKVLYTNMGYTI